MSFNNEKGRQTMKRRKAKAKDIVTIRFGRGPTGVDEVCAACGGEARAWPSPKGMAYGVAEISCGGEASYLPLCEACFDDDSTFSFLARKEFKVSDLKITEGGTLTTEQFEAMYEKARFGRDEH
jgi:hypothetical protein